MTEFSDIYTRALFKMKNYGLLKLSVANREQVLREYLMSAQINFVNACRFDLNDYDETEQRYNVTLGNEEIDILAAGIVYHWVSSETLKSDSFRNTLLKKDYQQYSPANLLKVMLELRSTLKRDFEGRINAYSFKYGSLDG